MPNDGPAGGLTPPLPEATHGPAASRRRAILTACLIATFMAAVESSIVATAIPTLVGDLGGFELFSWVFTIYVLTQAVSIPIYGRLADLYGRRRTFFFGTGLFLIGSTLCGFAWGMVPLICFRALQGIGAGGIMPIASTILGDIYSPTERAHIQGLVSSVFGVSAVIGPSLGAFLIQHVGWPVVFWINIPIGVTAIAMIAVYLREAITPRQHRIDWLGSVLLLVSVSSLLLALNGAGGTAGTLGLAVTGIGSLAWLYWHERATVEPMLPLELWRNRMIAVGGLGNAGSGALMLGVSAFLPTYVQGVMGRSPMVAGLVLGAMSVSWALFSLMAGRIMMRSSYRMVTLLGGLALVVGCGMLLMLSPAQGPWWAALGSFVIGIGMGFCSTSFIVSVQAAVPWRQRGAATSSNMFLRFVGQSLGAAGCGAVLNASITRIDPAAIGSVDRLLDPAARAGLSGEAISHLTEVVSRSLHNAYALAFLFAVATLVVGIWQPAGLSPARPAAK